MNQIQVQCKGRIVVDQGTHLGKKSDKLFDCCFRLELLAAVLVILTLHGLAQMRYVALVGQVNCGKATRLRSLGGAVLPDNFDYSSAKPSKFS